MLQNGQLIPSISGMRWNRVLVLKRTPLWLGHEGFRTPGIAYTCHIQGFSKERSAFARILCTRLLERKTNFQNLVTDGALSVAFLVGKGNPY